MCMCTGVFVLEIMNLLAVEEFKPVMQCVCFWYSEQTQGITGLNSAIQSVSDLIIKW